MVAEITTAFCRAHLWKLANSFVEEGLFKPSHKGPVGTSQVKSAKNVKGPKEEALVHVVKSEASY